MAEGICITGAGLVSAIGLNCRQTLRALLDGRSGVGRPKFLQTEHQALPCGEVQLSDARLSSMLGVEGLSRTAMLGILAAQEALSTAGLLDGGRLIGGERVALVSGTTVAGMDLTERHYMDYLGEADAGRDFITQHDCRGNTARIADWFGGFGYVSSVSTACSSAANAIIAGAELIQGGAFDIVLAGGAEALTRYHLNGFNSLMILDHEPCRPFDESRAGLNLGEGAGWVVLESGSSVRRRGVGRQVLGTLDGWGNACDAFHQTASSPDGDGAYLSMKQALAMAGLAPSEVDYVNAHGTGTPNNDESESHALRRVFGENLPPISSTKGFTGHTTSASGSIEAVICLLAMHQGFLPENIGFSTPFEGGIVPVTGIGRHSERPLRHVLCNAFGFGGNDSSLLLGLSEASGGGLAFANPGSASPTAPDIPTPLAVPGSPTPTQPVVSDCQTPAQPAVPGNSATVTTSASDTSDPTWPGASWQGLNASATGAAAVVTSLKSDAATMPAGFLRLGGFSEPVYVYSAAQISAQKPLCDEWVDAPQALDGQYVRAIDPEWRQYLDPMKARRMGRLMKRCLVTSLEALRQAGFDGGKSPDAVITGTGLGCIESTERFLGNMLRPGEGTLSPTDFMQSTHNTLGSLISITTGNHGQNTTWSNGVLSFESALADALVKLSLGRVRSALVGAHDEVTPDTVTVLRKCCPEFFDRADVPYSEGSAAFVIGTGSCGARGGVTEGGAKDVAERGAGCIIERGAKDVAERGAKDVAVRGAGCGPVAEIAGLCIIEHPDAESVGLALRGLLRGLSGSLQILTGENGADDGLYPAVLGCVSNLRTDSQLSSSRLGRLRFKRLFGEGMSASALGAYAAVHLLERHCADNALLVNCFHGEALSLLLLKSV